MQHFTRHSPEVESSRQALRQECRFRQREAWAFTIIGSVGSICCAWTWITAWSLIFSLGEVKAILVALVTLTFVMSLACGLSSFRQVARFPMNELAELPEE